ncbi:MAG TPA: periplasmic heavy metal sensor [Gammaproteobacteria bacterium]|nr:periplasmic heavy metal sensor [Gammaproteobacteria bacterium]
MTRKAYAIPFTLLCALALSAPAYAGQDTKPHRGNMDKGMMGMGKAHPAPHHSVSHGKKKSHLFTPHWSKTLSDEQKLAVDKMHLVLARDMAVLKAQKELLQKELNVLTAMDNADKNAIYAKIDTLMTINAKIMRHRYDHILEMRDILTPEQRISYDMGILKRSGAK